MGETADLLASTPPQEPVRLPQPPVEPGRRVRAAPAADGKSFRLRVSGSQSSGFWEGVFPIEKLDDWIATYEGLRDRKGGKYRDIHQPVVEALQKLKRRLAQ